MSSFFKKIFQQSSSSSGDSKSSKHSKCSSNVPSSTSEASKKKLMRRLALAQNDPEPLLDLSDLELTKLGEQILSLIKVYHKQRVHLERNRLATFQLNSLSANYFCNVTVLHLEDNQIVSFDIDNSPAKLFDNLKELYLNGNRLSLIPAQLFRLPQLKVLSVRHNFLSEIPSELFPASAVTNKLVYCDLAFNQIVELPSKLSIVNIPNTSVSLQTLNLEGNPLHMPSQLYLAENCHDVSCFLQISACLARFYNLTQFHPSTGNGGKQINEEKIVKANNNGLLSAEIPAMDYKEQVDEDDDEEIVRDEIDDRFMRYAQKKLEAKQNKIEFERNIYLVSDHHNNSSDQHSTAQVTCKDKLLHELCTEQDVLFERINQFHSKKDAEKQKILDNYVAQLQEHSSRLIEKLSLDALILSKGECLDETPARKNADDVQLLNQDICQLLNQYETKLALKRSCVLDSLEATTQQEEEQLNQTFLRKDDAHDSIFKQLEKQEDSLSQAFEKLLADRDRRNEDLTQKIFMVEQELRALTFIERERKDVRNDQILSELHQQRSQLAQFLATLLDLKRQREKQLKEMIQQEMSKRFEDSPNSHINGTTNSWIEQLQILLQKEPFEVQVRQYGIDVRVANILTAIYDDLENESCLEPSIAKNRSLFQNKLVYYLPQFIDISFERFCTLTAVDLMKQFTIDDYELCEFIEKHVDKILAKQKLCDNYRNTIDPDDAIYKGATSPELDLKEQTSNGHNDGKLELEPKQTWYESECVICLSNQSDIVFLPCGHICTCQNCIRPNASTVSLCPLCREEIDFMQSIVAGK